jgi:hypothetical protein
MGKSSREKTREMWQAAREMRDRRIERFEADILPLLEARYDVRTQDGGSRYSVFGTPNGDLTLHIKANTLKEHKTGQWHKPAVQWLFKRRII